jgi:superfamily II DNA or RNA helicase
LRHWSLHRAIPGLISMPTGTGKTLVSIAAAHIAQGNRVLVVVPSTHLRRQTVEAFRDQLMLRSIGAIGDSNARPHVVEITGLVRSWDDLNEADVVVGLPNSVSPAHYEQLPLATFFDVVIVDEAHHAPARTWRAILEYFTDARAVLLTATPRRRDNQQVPGELIYHYPLRQALDEGIYQKVTADILPLPAPGTREAIDDAIANRVVMVLERPEHSTSAVLIRASGIDRANGLAALYRQKGLSVATLNSRMGKRSQQAVIDGLAEGTYRAAAIVGMLIEGFDMPSLRVAAYHDKHKSLGATAQLIGRLARVDPKYPQESVVVTVRDIDVYPELHGAVRELYEEDQAWSEILPGILDAEIAREESNRDYVRQFAPAPPSLSLDAVHPLRRAVICEVGQGKNWQPSFLNGTIPDDLGGAHVIQGRSILYAGLNFNRTSLMLITMGSSRPPWHDDPGLDTPLYELHIVSFRASHSRALPHLLLINSGDGAVIRELLAKLGAGDVAEPADPERLNAAFDSLERLSVSSIGVRNTYAGVSGMPSYKIYAGSGVDRGLRSTDTAFGALGHAIVQATDTAGSFSAGMAASKSKYWERRYASLRDYEEFVTQLAERYWFPAIGIAGPLLPQVARGSRLTEWPNSKPVVVELHAALIGGGWEVPGGAALDQIDLQPAPNVEQRMARGYFPFDAVHLDGNGNRAVIWQGEQDLTGRITATGPEINVRRGYSGSIPLADLLAERPPNIYFLDGHTVQGHLLTDSRTPSQGLPLTKLEPFAWSPGTNIEAETRRAAAAAGAGVSVHEALEAYLIARPRRAKHRWIISNDGGGEIADYIVLEIGSWEDVHLSFWHAKPAGGRPGVRVTDVEVAVAQAIKSRRWVTDTRVWREIGGRLAGRLAPRAFLVGDPAGDSRLLLDVLLGERARLDRYSLARRIPIVKSEVYIVQPGLSKQMIHDQLATAQPPLLAVQTRDLLAVFHDSVSQVAQTVGVLCSP